MHLGYARASADTQDLTNQRTELVAAGCKKLFAEKHTGAQRDRAQIGWMLVTFEPVKWRPSLGWPL
jgi:DNA invertase Pin-like site-specific DNA recombinase